MISNKVDYQYWLAMPLWSIEEAALLLCKLDPDNWRNTQLLERKGSFASKVYEILNRACSSCELYKYDNKYNDIALVMCPRRNYTILTYIRFWQAKLKNIIPLPKELVDQLSDALGVKAGENYSLEPSESEKYTGDQRYKMHPSQRVIQTLSMRQLLERWNNRYTLVNVYEMAEKGCFGLYVRVTVKLKKSYDIEKELNDLISARSIDSAERKYYIELQNLFYQFINSHPYLLEAKDGYERLAIPIEEKIFPACSESGSLSSMKREKAIWPSEGIGDTFGFVIQDGKCVAKKYCMNPITPFASEEDGFVFIDQIERFEKMSEFAAGIAVADIEGEATEVFMVSDNNETKKTQASNVINCKKLLPCQEDKLECQKIAREEWNKNPNFTIVEMIKHERIAPYANKYHGKNTIRDWLSPVDPRSFKAKRGRPKKKIKAFA